MGEFESFVARLRTRKEQDVTEITIPKNVVEFGGYKDGDLIQVMIKKQDKVNE